MDPSDQATMVEGRGIEGNANQGGKRQVTIISKEMWEKLMDEVGGDKDPAIFCIYQESLGSCSLNPSVKSYDIAQNPYFLVFSFV